jgi:hypothetical protein
MDSKDRIIEVQNEAYANLVKSGLIQPPQK